MDTLSAFAMGNSNKYKEQMIFDWIKCAKILKEKNIKNASAGLSLDLEWTEGDILINGKIPEDSYCYLSSTWAIPVLIIGKEHTYDNEVSCYCMQSEHPEWNSETFWSEEAKKIMGL